jgi:hypothetical protein
MPEISNLGAPCGVWIHGLAGCGKSREARTTFPENYPKAISQWWDMYVDQRVVILEDVSPFHVKYGDQLKIWADEYKFIADFKGKSRLIRPKLFIVTSQYKIEDIWRDEETRAALNRRFTVVNKLERDVMVLGNWDNEIYK